MHCQAQLPREPEEPGEISLSRARELAELHIRIFGPRIRTFLEERRGASIDFARLQAGAATYYGSTPYESLSDAVHPGVRKRYGSYYIVPLVLRDAPEDVVISLAVSARNSDISTAGGEFRYSVEHGNDFTIDAVPIGTSITMPVTPEWAAQAAARMTGSHVNEVPELQLQGVQ